MNPADDLAKLQSTADDLGKLRSTDPFAFMHGELDGMAFPAKHASAKVDLHALIDSAEQAYKSGDAKTLALTLWDALAHFNIRTCLAAGSIVRMKRKTYTGTKADVYTEWGRAFNSVPGFRDMKPPQQADELWRLHGAKWSTERTRKDERKRKVGKERFLRLHPVNRDTVGSYVREFTNDLKRG
jgi:hypothetical protein